MIITLSIDLTDVQVAHIDQEVVQQQAHTPSLTPEVFLTRMVGKMVGGWVIASTAQQSRSNARAVLDALAKAEITEEVIVLDALKLERRGDKFATKPTAEPDLIGLPVEVAR